MCIFFLNQKAGALGRVEFRPPGTPCNRQAVQKGAPSAFCGHNILKLNPNNMEFGRMSARQANPTRQDGGNDAKDSQPALGGSPHVPHTRGAGISLGAKLAVKLAHQSQQVPAGRRCFRAGPRLGLVPSAPAVALWLISQQDFMASRAVGLALAEKITT
jgi:hypothetical protein